MESYKDMALIYDELINTDINYLVWKEKILSICKEFNINFEEYLDLACGTGNMTELLSPFFKSTWGVDLSEDMLIVAEEKLRSKRIRPKLICQDITLLNLNKKFDLITCCLDSTNYITKERDIQKFFIGVCSHLKTNGIFIFDVNSYHKLKNIIGSNTFTYCENDLAYIWENYPDGDNICMLITFFIKEGDVYRRFDEEHIERAYTDTMLDKVLCSCGLNIIYKLDNYSSNHINSLTERITYVVMKQ